MMKTKINADGKLIQSEWNYLMQGKKGCSIKLKLVSQKEREELRIPSYGYLFP